jgi:hypothetical protein
MKNFLIGVFLLTFAISQNGFSQLVEKRQEGNTTIGTYRLAPFTPKGVNMWDPFIPIRDTVIVVGESIEVGGYLSEAMIKEIEIVGFGRSKKSDLKKGFYFTTQKPKKTITYEFKWFNIVHEKEMISRRAVYVVQNEEEKKTLENKIKENKKKNSPKFINNGKIKVSGKTTIMRE